MGRIWLPVPKCRHRNCVCDGSIAWDADTNILVPPPQAEKEVEYKNLHVTRDKRHVTQRLTCPMSYYELPSRTRLRTLVFMSLFISFSLWRILIQESTTVSFYSEACLGIMEIFSSL